LVVRGARCTHLSGSMPYRNPERRAAWMREYRKRKRERRMRAPVSLPSPRFVVRPPEPSRVSQRIPESPSPQAVRSNTGFVRQGAGSSFKTALELARPFPFGVLASRVCPYCYTPATARPAHGAAIAGVERDEGVPLFFADVT